MDTHNSRIILAFTVFALLITLVKPDCVPVREGSTAIIDCSIKTIEGCQDTNILTWTARDRSNGGVILSFPCTSAGCQSSFSGFTASISGSSPNFTSTITMTGVSSGWPNELIGGVWECEAACSDNVITACASLELYALPDDAECIATRLFDGDNNLISVNISCATTLVYPEADCIFYDMVDGNDPVSISGVVSDCQLIVPAEDIAVGTHRYMGRVYPSVTGGESLEGIVNIAATPDVVIAPEDDDDDDELIIGLICGGAGLVILILIVICCLVQKNRQKEEARSPKPQRQPEQENWTLKGAQREAAEYQHTSYSMDPTMGEQTQSRPQPVTYNVSSWGLKDDQGESATSTFEPALMTKL